MQEEMNNYKNVARYLDGEKLQLDAEEQALLEEFCLDESTVNDALSPEFSSEITRLISDRVGAALNTDRPRRRAIHLFRWTAAAAAIIIITTIIFFQASNSQDSTRRTSYRDTPSQFQSDEVLYDQMLSESTSEFVDPSEDEIDIFLEPLLVDDTAQTIMDTDPSENNLIDEYFSEPDNVMLQTSDHPQA